MTWLRDRWRRTDVWPVCSDERKEREQHSDRPSGAGRRARQFRSWREAMKGGAREVNALWSSCAAPGLLSPTSSSSSTSASVPGAGAFCPGDEAPAGGGGGAARTAAHEKRARQAEHAGVAWAVRAVLCSDVRNIVSRASVGGRGEHSTCSSSRPASSPKSKVRVLGTATCRSLCTGKCLSNVSQDCADGTGCATSALSLSLASSSPSPPSRPSGVSACHRAGARVVVSQSPFDR